MAKNKFKSNNTRELIPLSVKEFINKYSHRIDLDADYQREKIWGREAQETLLDSIIKDIDIPKMYLVSVTDNKPFEFDCIDGKQRMSTLLSFFKPDSEDENPLTIKPLDSEKYTYERLKKEHPSIAKKMEDYELHFIIYKSLDDVDVREIFRRLQLGIRLNSGELLKTKIGGMRDFIYKEIGNDGFFFRKSNLSIKRFSRPFTLAQICINSFAKANDNEEPDEKFVRARFEDIENFFYDHRNIDKKNKNLERIRTVLKLMEKAFGEDAFQISSRAIAVTAYLFSEELYIKGEKGRIHDFAKFYIKLLREIERDMELLSSYHAPKNPYVLDGFQRYILQASVEGSSVRRRHEFLKMAFDHYTNSETRGEIIKRKPKGNG